MLLNIFRVLFIIAILAALFVNITSDTISVNEKGEFSEEIRRANFFAILWSGFVMAVFVFLLDILTPKKKLSALAGVFFGLLVGMLISGALAPVVDMIAGSYRINLTPPAVYAIKWMLGI